MSTKAEITSWTKMTSFVEESKREANAALDGIGSAAHDTWVIARLLYALVLAVLAEGLSQRRAILGIERDSRPGVCAALDRDGRERGIPLLEEGYPSRGLWGSVQRQNLYLVMLPHPPHHGTPLPIFLGDP